MDVKSFLDNNPLLSTINAIMAVSAMMGISYDKAERIVLALS